MLKMKKVCLILVLVLFLSTIKVYAASYDVELAGNSTAKQGEEINLTLKVKDLQDIGGTAGGLAGLTAKVTYDKDKLEKVSLNPLNGFMGQWEERIEIVRFSGSGVTEDTEIATMTFKVKNTAALGDTSIILSEISAPNGTTNIPSIDITKTIKIESTDAVVEKSSNNFLSSLKVDGTEVPGFNKNTLTYTLTAVENSKTSIEILAAVEDSKASISGTGTKNLIVGNNKFNIVVSAEDGTTKTYTINVERKVASTINNDDNGGSNVKDTTVVDKNIPQTGVNIYIPIVGISIALVIAIISFKKLKELKRI